MNNKESDRITRLETQVSEMRLITNEVRTDVKKIMENELPHLKILINEEITKLQSNIDKRIDKLDKKVVILWSVLTVIATLAGAIANRLISKYL